MFMPRGRSLQSAMKRKVVCPLFLPAEHDMTRTKEQYHKGTIR